MRTHTLTLCGTIPKLLSQEGQTNTRGGSAFHSLADAHTTLLSRTNTETSDTEGADQYKGEV